MKHLILAAPILAAGVFYPDAVAPEAPMKPVASSLERIDQPFAAPSSGMLISGGADSGAGLSLYGLLAEYGRVTNQAILVSEGARASFSSRQVGVINELAVAPGELHSFVGSTLLAEGIGLVMIHAGSPRALAAIDLNSSEVRSIRSNALYVPSEQLTMWSEQPALLVTTSLHLPHTDVRQLATSLRALVPDQSTQALLSVGSSNSLVVTGFAERLVQMAAMLGSIDAAAAAAQLEEGDGTSEDDG